MNPESLTFLHEEVMHALSGCLFFKFAGRIMKIKVRTKCKLYERHGLSEVQ